MSTSTSNRNNNKSYTDLHLARSHATEGDVPGTVNLRAAEGDDVALGQALFPVPSHDPNDPLQWEAWKKTTILVVVSLYSFVSNTALLGPSTYIGIYAQEFGITPTKASGLISYPNVSFSFANQMLIAIACGERESVCVQLKDQSSSKLTCEEF